ncbi:unnamed protein product [Musa banksii]
MTAIEAAVARKRCRRRPQKRRTRRRAEVREERRMRSSVQGGDDASEASAALANCWWRSLIEFDGDSEGGRTEAAAGSRGAVASPRVRVLRELERLAAAANVSLDDIRHKLLTYNAGDLWLPAGGIPKHETDIPPVITILLLGLAGTGKTALVDLMYCVLGRAGFLPFAQSIPLAGSNDGRTQCLEEHNVLRSMRSGFCIFDSRGLDCDRMADGLEEVADWMTEGVRHGQPCRGANPPDAPAPASAPPATRFLRRRVNCPVVVANLYELHHSLLSGDPRPLEATRDLFHYPPIKINPTDSPILVLTHGDELSPEERIQARVKTCEYLGVSETNGVYDISCLNEYGTAVDEMDPATSYAVAEAIFRALVVADRTHPAKASIKEWLLVVITWAMCALSTFFAFLSCCCSKLAKANREYTKLRTH